MTNKLQLTFVNIEEENTKVFKKVFADQNNIKCLTSDITQIFKQHSHDCVISPANSYGLMDGGVDKSISDFYPQLMKRVQTKIDRIYHGAQPIGTCLLIKTGQDLEGYPEIMLAHSPTMAIPKDVSGTINAYAAFKAVLCAIQLYNQENTQTPIRKVLTTSFCDGSGEMSIDQSALQMRLAYDHIMLNPTVKHNWSSAYDHENQISQLII